MMEDFIGRKVIGIPGENTYNNTRPGTKWIVYAVREVSYSYGKMVMLVPPHRYPNNLRKQDEQPVYLSSFWRCFALCEESNKESAASLTRMEDL